MATFTNTATLSYGTNTVNSNTVTGEIQATLTANKTALRGSYASGDVITYIVNIINSGAAAFNDLTLTDNLGAYMQDAETRYPLSYTPSAIRYYLNGVLQAQPSVTQTQPLTVTGITVPAGGIATLVYEAVVNAFAPLAQGSTIENIASITGDGVTEALEASTQIQVRNEARLTVTKALSPLVVTENGQVTYTFTIQNFGNTAADDTQNAVLADIFLPELNITSVTYDGSAWTLGQEYTYSQPGGQFATLAGKITVPAATFAQNVDGSYTVTPGVGTLVVTGTI